MRLVLIIVNISSMALVDFIIVFLAEVNPGSFDSPSISSISSSKVILLLSFAGSRLSILNIAVHNLHFSMKSSSRVTSSPIFVLIYNPDLTAGLSNGDPTSV